MIENGLPKRVLIVDDKKNIADTLDMIFKMKGHESMAAYSAESAVETVESFEPDKEPPLITRHLGDVDVETVLKVTRNQSLHGVTGNRMPQLLQHIKGTLLRALTDAVNLWESGSLRLHRNQTRRCFWRSLRSSEQFLLGPESQHHR